MQDNFMYLIEKIGTEGLSTFAVITVMFFGGRYFYRTYMSENKNNGKQLKILIIEAVLIFFGFVEALSAAYATGEDDEDGMVFGIRLGTHAACLILNTGLMMNIWGELKEAIMASKVLGKLLDYKHMNYDYGLSIIANFVMQWVQLLAVLYLGLIAIGANLYLMGVSTGEGVQVQSLVSFVTPYVPFITIDLHADYIGWTLIDILGDTKGNVQSCFILSCMHILGILTLGALSFDDKLAQKGSNKTASNAAPNIPSDQIYGYYATHISGTVTGAAAMTSSHISALLDVDPSSKFTNSLKLEDLYHEAIKFRKISADRSKPSGDRTRANSDLQAIHAKMVTVLKDINDHANTFSAGGSST